MKLTILHIARKNLRRRLFRSLAIAASVAVVAGTLFSVTTVMESVERSLKRGTARLGADVIVVPEGYEAKARAALLAGEPSTFYMPRSVVDKVRKINGVLNASGQLFVQSAAYACCDVADMLLIGFNPKTDFTITSWLKESLNRDLAPDEVIIGRELSAYTKGSKISFFGSEFTVADYLEVTGMRFIDNSVFIPFEGVRKMVERSKTHSEAPLTVTPDQVSAILVQVRPDMDPARVAIFIEHEIEGVKTVVSEDVITSVRKQLFVLLRSILIISGILWIMALLMIGVIFSMIVNERQREIGLVRAMGATRKKVFGLVMSEASILSLLGGAAGVVVGGVLLFSFKNMIKFSLNVPFLWPEPAEFGVIILLCMTLAFLTGIGAALYPALRSSLMEPYAAIRKGE